MLRNIGKLFGESMAALCLLSTLALAQSPPVNYSTPPQLQTQARLPSQDLRRIEEQTQARLPNQEMTCLADDGLGTCITAARSNGEIIPVLGEHAKIGDKMMCADLVYIVNCTVVK